MKKTILLGCMLGFLPVSSFATTLGQAVSTAVHTNPRVLGAIKGRHANDYAIEKARAGYFPSIDLGAGYGYENSKSEVTNFEWKDLDRRELSAELKQNIFQGFFTTNEMKRTRANVNAAAYDIQGVANDVALDAVRAYLDLRREQALLQISEKNVKTHENVLAMLNQRTKAGLSRKGDLAQTKGRLALAKSNVVAVKSEIRAATATYTAIVGKLPMNLVSAPEVSLKNFPKSEQDAVTFALENNPFIKVATSNVEGRHAQWNASKSLYSPRLDAVAAVTRNHDIDGREGKNWDDLIMLRASWNILNGGGDRALVNENAQKLFQSKEVRDDTTRQAIEQVKLAWAAYESAKERLPYLKVHFNEAMKTVASYTDQYKLGKRTLLDLLDAENELFHTSREYTITKYQLLFSEYRILHTMYALLSYLKVPMPDASVPMDEVKTVVAKHNKGSEVEYYGKGFIEVDKQPEALHTNQTDDPLLKDDQSNKKAAMATPKTTTATVTTTPKVITAAKTTPTKTYTVKKA